MPKFIWFLVAATLIIVPPAFAASQSGGARLAQAPAREGAPQGKAGEGQEEVEELRKRAEERVRDQAEEPPEATEQAPRPAESRAREAAEQRNEAAERAGAQGRGEETSAEMQRRRDERKEIMEEYRTGERDRGRPEDTDEDEQGEEKDKKPWWKFWE